MVKIILFFFLIFLCNFFEIFLKSVCENESEMRLLCQARGIVGGDRLLRLLPLFFRAEHGSRLPELYVHLTVGRMLVCTGASGHLVAHALGGH